MSTETPMSCSAYKCNVFDSCQEIFDDRFGEPNHFRLAFHAWCSHVDTVSCLHQSNLPNFFRQQRDGLVALRGAR